MDGESGLLVDELICRSLKGSTSDTEDKLLLEWRRTVEANEQYYQDLVHLLRLTEVVAGSQATPAPAATDLIALAVDERGALSSGGRPREAPRRGWLIALALAASVLLAIPVGWYALRPFQREFNMGAGEFITGPTETTTITLGDGTVVRLAPRSRLRVMDAPGRREVFLHGRAYFAVASMERMRFRVNTDQGDVVVLGTQFEVKADEELRVVVIEGRVTLGADGQNVNVNAGEMSMATNGMVTPPVKVDVQPIIAWVGRFVAFQSTPLHEAAKVLARMYHKRVIVTDRALGELTITGWYMDRDFEEIVTIICGVLDANCSIQNGTATIRP